MPNDQVMPLGEQSDASVALPVSDLPIAESEPAEAGSPGGRAAEEILRTRLSEELDAALESSDPVAGLDHAVQTVADELSRQFVPDRMFENSTEPDDEVADAIATLVRVAVEMGDPVAALEEGVDTLAAALTERSFANQAPLEAAHERRIDEQAAYQHARIHRVSELMDAGYGVDEAVRITNADEADIRARARAWGRDPMEPIYQYAVLNGYRGTQSTRTGSSADVAAGPSVAGRHERRSPLMALAELSDEAFAEATKGGRWHEIMQT